MNYFLHCNCNSLDNHRRECIHLAQCNPLCEYFTPRKYKLTLSGKWTVSESKQQAVYFVYAGVLCTLIVVFYTRIHLSSVINHPSVCFGRVMKHSLLFKTFF